MTTSGWLVLWLEVALLSFLQVGGALTVAPDLHRLVVDGRALATDAQFTAALAIAQAAPGPNTLYVAVLGYQVAGVAGAVAGQLAILLPSSLLAVAVARSIAARGGSRAIAAFQQGLAPTTIALLVATSWLVVSGAPAPGLVLLAVASALLVWRTRVHVLWLIAAGAALGAAGLV